MKTSKFSIVSILLSIFFVTAVISGEVSLTDARKIGEKSLKELTDQSYHYRVDYDTVVVVPVHSKTIWKNDFYLLYFLKDDYFQVEMEIDKVTGKATILAMGTMSPPYHEMHTGTFNHRYFNLDSIMVYASKRQRIEQDSARLVYFGVIPKLGKRGVIWEIFSAEGTDYLSLGGPNLTQEQLVVEINTKMHTNGNYVADSIRVGEITAEITRLKGLTDANKRDLKLYPQVFDSLITALREEKKQIIIKFPNLGRDFPMDEE